MMDPATSSTHCHSKEERYDPAVNFNTEFETDDDYNLLNNQCCTQKTSCAEGFGTAEEEEEEGEGEVEVDWIYNDFSSPQDISGGPQDCCGLDYCEGGILSAKYSAKSTHITTETKMYPADENRWACRKPHPKLCKPCYGSKTCPVHGLDFDRL